MRLKIFFTIMAVIFFMASDVFAAIEITDERATAEYWTKRNPRGDEIIFPAQEIKTFNEKIILGDDYSADLYDYPQTIPTTKFLKLLKKATNDVNVKTNPATSADTNSGLPAVIVVRYAVTLERVNLRLSPVDWNGDRFDPLQGTAVDPAEAVAVLRKSTDGKFFFVQTRNYFGWIEKSKLAFTTRETWLNYVKPKNFLVVTANKKFVEVDGKKILFQMGAKIPLDKKIDDGEFWRAILPTVEGGKLKQTVIKIPKDDTVNKGFLPCTTNNFIRQSFKFLGDPYGWGGLYDSVDCSAFVSDVYRSMGIEIPRDADRQSKLMPNASVFDGKNFDERIEILKRSPTGSLLHKKGHVLMLLGSDDEGTPIAIHAASSYYLDDKKIYVSKVLVSALDEPNDYGVSTVKSLINATFVK
ncbi:MAG: SH3 domain-containing protein [Selenomonadaceae bacterium]|nr:SH3 domain-containing protein [Selenomonadaceae bacterium]